MDQLDLLLFLSFAMLVGSFLAGMIPMAFRLSDNKSRLLALMGSGILVGTALAIIIPEGIDSLYSQSQINFPLKKHDQEKLNESIPMDKIGAEIVPISPVKSWTVGVALIAGFALMLLIDQFSIYQNKCSDSPENLRHQDHKYTLASIDEDDEEVVNNDDDQMVTELVSETSETRPIRDLETHRVSMRGLENDNQYQKTANGRSSGNQSKVVHQPVTSISHRRAKSTKVTPTLGLVIHAAADGIALGAAATTSHREVEMIIFLAIMLHKGPAAFSLVVFLLHRGIKHSTIRRHLLAFSLSAPLAALLTFFGLSQSGKEALRQNNATGIAMLFSAGTFLYVATVHVMPELVHNRLLTPKELLFLLGGSFLPVILAQTV